MCICVVQRECLSITVNEDEYLKWLLIAGFMECEVASPGRCFCERVKYIRKRTPC